MSNHYKDKAVRGFGWSAVDGIAQYIVTFLIGILLARILSPDDFGLLGLTTIFVALSNTFINGGVIQALIRKKEVTDDDYNTAFLVNIGMSVFLFFLLFTCAPFISEFFRRDELILLIRVSSLKFIIGSLSLVQNVQLVKRIDFKTKAKISLTSAVIGGFLGISLAYFGAGVWALVIQELTTISIRTISLWVIVKWIPRFHFYRQSFNELFGYGSKILMSELLDTLWREMSNAVIGRFYNSATLGQYTRSRQFSSILSNNLTLVVQRVTLPVLADIQDERKRLTMAYKKIIKCTMFVSAIGMFLMGAISEPLLYCLIGPKWHEAAVYLPLICISGSTYPLQAINLNMLKVQGRSDLILSLEVIKKLVAIIPLIIGAFIGIMPMLYTYLVTCVISFFLNSHYSGKLIGYSSIQQLRDISPSYLIALIVAISVYFIKYIPISPWVILPLQIMVAVIVFFVISYWSQMDEYKEIKGIVAVYLRKLKD